MFGWRKRKRRKEAQPSSPAPHAVTWPAPHAAIEAQPYLPPGSAGATVPSPAAAPPMVAAPMGAPPPAPVDPYAWVPFRNGVPHIEIATSEGATLVIGPDHPLFEQFRRWSREWALPPGQTRVFRVHPEAVRAPGIGTPRRGRVRAH